MHDAVGNLVSKSYANGIDTTYSYDAASRLTGLETRLGAQVLDSYSQVYDPSGNITAMTQLGQGTSTYAYDALDRLTAENISGYGNITYSYDGVGNRTAVNNPATGLTTYYQYNPANQLVSLTGNQGTTSFSYDAAGALVSSANGAGTSTYTYDGLDRLSAVSTPSGDASYSYDALGRRVTRTEGSYTERRHMTGFSDYADYMTDGSGALTGATLRGADGLIAYTAYWPGGQFVGYQHFNPHGDTTQITDTAGNPLYSSRYDSFGNAVSGGGLTFGYSAKWSRLTEDLTGTVQMGVRDYDPALGRFTSVDPLRGTPFDPQQRNRYTFTGNNPLVRYDLSGFAWCAPTLGDEIGDMAGWVSEQYDDWKYGAGIMWNSYLSPAVNIIFDEYFTLADPDASWEERGVAIVFLASRGFGKAAKGVKLADDLLDGARALDKIGDAGKAVDRAGDATKDLATVYRSFDEAGNVNYVGITNNMRRRAAEQARGPRGIKIREIEGFSDISRADARGVEQALIEHHGLSKNGGTLTNRINSIAASNPMYEDAVKRGRELLGQAGYSGF